jgi:hypothetical protein
MLDMSVSEGKLFPAPSLNMYVKSEYRLQYIELKYVYPDRLQIRIAANTALSVVTQKCLNAVVMKVVK